jgi:hypothetical protein
VQSRRIWSSISPERITFYRMRAFEQEVSVGAKLWRAFDKPFEGGRWRLLRMRADGGTRSSGYGN